MLQTCLKDTNITTCFFINTLDFPVLYKRNCKQHILNEVVCSINKKIDNGFIPVLSGATTDEYYDKCIVYVDSWEIASQKKFLNRGEYINRYNKKEFNKINTSWDKKQNELVFRGKNNSCYLNDFEKNDRLKVLNALKELRDNKDIPSNINLNVGLKSLTNKTLIGFKNNKYFLYNSDKQKITKQLGDFINVKGLSMVEQSNRKYILDIDGYVTAWRLSCELSYNSCIILVKSKFDSWFYDKLKHMENVYIIDVDKPNIKDEFKKALYLLSENDKVGKKIANGARKLYDKIMNLNYIKKYMVNMLSGAEFQNIIV